MLVFVEGEKPKNREKNARNNKGKARKTTINSTHIWPRAGIKLRPHWWEASALAAPSLLPIET